MKIDNGLPILARQNPMTEDDWLTLVNIRKDMILDSIRDMTLQTLGGLKIPHDYFGTHSIERDAPTVHGVTSLNIRGIFPSDDNWAAVSDTEYHRDNSGHCTATTERLWGLTRNGAWIAIEVYITRSRQPYKYAGRTEEVAKAEKVTIHSNMSIAEVCSFSKTTPKDIWNRLGQVVKDWVKHRRILYEDAKYLEEEILQEEAVLKVISGE